MRSLFLHVVLLAFFGFALTAPAQGQTPTIYVDWVTGSDTTGDGSLTSPYKTITQGLAMVTADGTTVEVAGGTMAVYKHFDGTGAVAEVFPLSADYDNITIMGKRKPQPKIDLDLAEGTFTGGVTAAVLVDGNTGWSIQRLDIDGTTFDKGPPPE